VVLIAARCEKYRRRTMAVSLRERIATHEAGHCVAAITYGVPIISVTVEDRPHLHRGRYHAPTPDLGREAMVVLCLSGPAAEELFCGRIEDGGDGPDLRMAREQVSRAIADPLRVGIELARCRVAAERLVSSKFAQDRIKVLAAALLQHGTLRGEQIAAFCAPDLVHVGSSG
jgi:hypothetical protein